MKNLEQKELIPPPIQIMNTQLNITDSDYKVSEYFKRVSKLGTYSNLNLNLNLKSLNLVVDCSAPWISNQLQKTNAHLESKSLKKLKLPDLLNICNDYMKSNVNLKNSNLNHLMLQIQKMGNTGSDTFYLDEYLNKKNQFSWSYLVYIQILIEKFTSLNSRLVLAKENNEITSNFNFCIIIETESGYKTLRIRNQKIVEVDCYNRFCSWSQLESYSNLKLDYFGFKIKIPKSKYDNNKKVFSLFTCNGKEVLFNVIGRSTAERIFKAQEESILAAGEAEEIPIEIGFHPFWRRLGHTTIRIGNALYEFSEKGWRVHADKEKNSRAFLFNNPFCKAQFRKFEKKGMSPLSIGTTILVEKYKVINLQIILENLIAARGWKRDKFSLLRNNCNHGVMRVLSLAGIEGFEENGYIAFSSVLSFRKMLIDPHQKVLSYNIYPLPGQNITEDNLRLWVPSLIYRHNDAFKEAVRALPKLLLDVFLIPSSKIFDKLKIILAYKKINKPDSNSMGANSTYA